MTGPDPTGGETVTVAVLLTAPRVAVTTADVLAVAPVTVTVHETEVAPAGTITDAPTGSTAELLDSDTDAPPAGAVAFRVAFRVTVAPLWTDVGDAVRAVRTGAFTVRAAVLVKEPRTALSVTALSALTAAGVNE